MHFQSRHAVLGHIHIYKQISILYYYAMHILCERFTNTSDKQNSLPLTWESVHLAIMGAHMGLLERPYCVRTQVSHTKAVWITRGHLYVCQC